MHHINSFYLHIYSPAHDFSVSIFPYVHTEQVDLRSIGHIVLFFHQISAELMFNREKCSGCGYCRKACSHGAITIEEDGTAHTDTEKCVLCADCLDYCLHNNREIVGKQYSIKELMTIVNKDAHFYEESGGGVTLSGLAGYWYYTKFPKRITIIV